VHVQIRFEHPIVTRDAKGFDEICLTVGDHVKCLKKQEKLGSEDYEWPGPQAGSGASIRIASTGGLFGLGKGVVDHREAAGNWGLFRLLLQQATASPGSTPTETMFTWWLDRRNIGIRCTVIWPSMYNPLTRPLAIRFPQRLN
jgi:hypothetical protein